MSRRFDQPGAYRGMSRRFDQPGAYRGMSRRFDQPGSTTNQTPMAGISLSLR